MLSPLFFDCHINWVTPFSRLTWRKEKAFDKVPAGDPAGTEKNQIWRKIH